MFPPCLVDEEQLLHVMAASVRHRLRGDRMAASKRKGKHLNDDKSYIRKDINGTTSPGLSGRDFNFGDIAWVRSGTCSWWPAQVVDEKSVGKPRKKAEGGVLVRLYGTHNCLCIDPVKNNEEFENMMKQNNSSIREMFEKALKEDLSRIKSHHKITGNPPPTEEHVSAGASTDVEMWDRIERNEETDLVNCVGASSVKDKEHRTHCTEAIEKARDVGSKIGRPTKYYIRKRQVRQKDRNCTQEIEKARDVGSKIKKPTQYYTRKRLARQKDRGGIPGDMKWEEDEKSGMTCSKNVDKASNFAPGNKKLKENINRTQPVTGKSGDGTLENLHEDKVEEQVSVKTGCEVIQNRDGKLKTKQQDLTKLEQHEVKGGKVKENGIREKKHKLTEKTQNEALKDDCERKSKQKDVSEHVVHESVMHSQVGKTPDASARRMKVMQTLALIAPSGSPYCKNCFSR